MPLWLFYGRTASDLAQILALVVEDFYAVCAIVGDEDLVFVVGANAVRKLEITRAAELLQHVAVGVENNYAHNLKIWPHFLLFESPPASQTLHSTTIICP